MCITICLYTIITICLWVLSIYLLLSIVQSPYYANHTTIITIFPNEKIYTKTLHTPKYTYNQQPKRSTVEKTTHKAFYWHILTNANTKG